MKPSIQKLQKFFKLEAERGYDNHAVLGGLERMLDVWVPEARLDGVPEDLIQAIVTRIRDYSRLTEKSRAETLQGLWRRIQRSESGLPPETPFEAEPVEQVREQTVDESLDRQASTELIVESERFGPSSQEAPIAIEPPEVQAVSSLPPAPPPVEPGALNASLTAVQGIGPRTAQTLERLGLHTLRDMLYFFPRRYDDYSRLKPINRLAYGEEVTVIGTVQSVNLRSMHGGKLQRVEAIVSDGTGSLRVSWFNQVWIARRLNPGAQISLSGKVSQYLGRAVMDNPSWEPLEQQQLSTNRIVPIYPLTAQITQRWLRRLVNQVVTYWAPRVPDPLPADLRRSAEIVDLGTALLQAHYPDSWEQLKAAQDRLAFDEIFLLQLGVLAQRRAWQDRTARAFTIETEWLDGQISLLPYSLTGAQKRAIDDVRQDLASGRPMNRLIQGDVGSGKTIVAALAIAMVAREGAQAALMTPTSILAEQHYQNLVQLLATQPQAAGVADSTDLPSVVLDESQIRLMIGATPEADKRLIRLGLADGSIKLVIGTHALIEDLVTFSNLELVVVDEQHRFGVEQRAALRAKGHSPHLLVMTATPIPRSLALTIYGDLDLSIMDEMPPGRQPVGTFVLTPRERERAYALIRSQVEQGQQVFIIYPLVEENEDSTARAAVDEQARLQKEVFPNFKLGLLHGRMRAEDKDQVMTDFRNGEYHILVSTTVIEVGVDIPNATVMLIEGANRFGLAQLHQLRGRVGRAAEKSFCLLIPDKADEAENERLQVMASTNDGFILAERDLEQRGPGQFLGTRQAGYAEFQFASLSDIRLIEKSRRLSQTVFEQDPDLDRPEHQLLALAYQRAWGGGNGDIS
ncbi:MAG: ATP-dependent DNA helicase RecG [Chloroflexi bacterium RBG_16_57_11]|nr:MAG: ATP-dependent DNA helicase RecG [Chloroflexi bacterium RBG_16_57_11]